MNKTKKPTIDDVAKLAGVSRATVSRILSNHESVLPKNRTAVYSAIRELNYSQSYLSTTANVIDAKQVVIIIPEIINPLWSRLIKGIYQNMIPYGVSVSIFDTNFQVEEELKCVEIASRLNPIGVIAVSSMPDSLISTCYSEFQCPVIFLDRALPNSHFHSIIQDNFQAGYIAAKHFLEQGYRKIGFLAGPEESISSNRRVEGFYEAMRQNFVSIDPASISHGEMSTERGISEAVKLCNYHKNPFEALLIINDATAVAFIDYAKYHGIRIPEDLAVLSFDDTDLAGLESFSLSTIRQPIDEMASVASELIINHAHNKTSPELRILLKPELIIRKSSVRPKE